MDLMIITIYNDLAKHDIFLIESLDYCWKLHMIAYVEPIKTTVLPKGDNVKSC